jgi:ribosomal protein S18 acetylase RimI-like enzyme
MGAALTTMMLERIAQVAIRTATAADTPAIIPLVNAAFAVETFLHGPRTDEERLSEMMRQGSLLLAALGGQAVACVYLELRGERAYFGMLAVDPSRQRTGLGRLMVTAAEQYGRDHGCQRMDISVLSLRPELLPFYRKLGYVETGTEEFRAARSLNAGECYCIVMSKEL